MKKLLAQARYFVVELGVIAFCVGTLFLVFFVLEDWV